VLRSSYFLTLGCRTNAAEPEIRHAFRKLAQHYHPDRLGPQALDFFTAIVEAYRGLRNPDQRTSYARGLQDDAKPSASRDVIMLEPSIEAPMIREVPAVCRDFIRAEVTAASRTLPWEHIADRILHNFLAGASAWHGRAEAIDLQIQIKAGDALRGGVAVIEVPGFYPCAACYASGRRDGEACLECAERGLVEESEEVRVALPPHLADYTWMEIPACGLGVHNLYLRLCFRIAGNSAEPSSNDARHAAVST
jgi:DnaJ-class molecular chaperone